jgi:CheY-like chemotaxis protein
MLMDLQMPEMNGFEAIVAIRGDFPDAKIIVTNVANASTLRC